MPPLGGGQRTKSVPGILYTANGTENPSAVLGNLPMGQVGDAQADELYRRARAIQDEPDVADLAPLFAPRLDSPSLRPREPRHAPFLPSSAGAASNGVRRVLRPWRTQ